MLISFLMSYLLSITCRFLRCCYLNLTCVWEIETSTPGAELVLVLTFRDIDGNTAMCYDNISIAEEGEDGETFCGNEVYWDPLTFTFDGKAIVEFESDDIQEERGFILTYKEIPPPPPTTTTEGAATSFTRDELIKILTNSLAAIGSVFGKC